MMLSRMMLMQSMKQGNLEMNDVRLSAKDVSRIRRLLMGIDHEASGKGRKSVISTRTRNIRLMLSKAERKASLQKDDIC